MLIFKPAPMPPEPGPEDPTLEYLLANPPYGFKVENLPCVLKIAHRRTGMGWQNTFLCFWTVGWILFWAHFMVLPESERGWFNNPWFSLSFLLPGIGVGLIFLYMLFNRRTYTLGESLDLESRTGVLRSRFSVAKEKISCVEQSLDGGYGDDSFPGYGVVILFGSGSKSLLHRQPFECSLWLGRVVATWAQVELKVLQEELDDYKRKATS